MTADAPISLCELMKSYLDANLHVDLCPGGHIVGPASDEAQKSGCVSITEAGNTERELYLPIINGRVQIRGIHPHLEHAERIGRALYALLNNVDRVAVLQPSTNERFLVHSMSVSAGPSNHFDSAETWESLIFISMKVGTMPIPV